MLQSSSVNTPLSSRLPSLAVSRRASLLHGEDDVTRMPYDIVSDVDPMLVNYHLEVFSIRTFSRHHVDATIGCKCTGDIEHEAAVVARRAARRQHAQLVHYAVLLVRRHDVRCDRTSTIGARGFKLTCCFFDFKIAMFVGGFVTCK